MLAVGKRSWGFQGCVRLTTRVEASVAVVRGGSGLTNSEGAQHGSGRVTHFEGCLGCLCRRRGDLYSGGIVTSFNGVACAGMRRAAMSVLGCERSDCERNNKTGVNE